MQYINGLPAVDPWQDDEDERPRNKIDKALRCLNDCINGYHERDRKGRYR